MQLHTIDIASFRNISRAAVAFAPRINLLLGANGQGKTNLIEAIAFLSWLRSFRTTRTKDLLQAGTERASLRATTEDRDGRHDLAVEIGPGFRRAVLDGHPVRAVRECLTRFTAVFLSPDDPAILEGGPDGRRGLLDRTASLLDASHGAVLARYHRLLRERNELLRQGAADPVVMDACEEALAEAAQAMIHARVRTLERLEPALQACLREMTGLDLEVTIRYAPKGWTRSGAEDREALLQALRASREADAAMGRTTVGPHGDDLEVRLLGLPARGHVSRGQRKVLLLAWKVAETTLVQEERAEPPVLILDDVLSDLDPVRQERVLAILDGYPGQSFLTAAVAPEHWNAEAIRRIRVVAGTYEVVLP